LALSIQEHDAKHPPPVAALQARGHGPGNYVSKVAESGYASYKPRWRASNVRGVVFDHVKQLRIAGNTRIALQRFACIGPKDHLLLPKYVGQESLYIPCANGLAQLWPPYSSVERVQIGGRNLEVTFKEIETTEEMEGYHRLSDFHYRGVELHGRRIPIVAVVSSPLLPRVIGYVELSTTFMMNKARSRILDAKFSDEMDINWEAWDLKAMQTKTNLITRIARCVVYPEFRGVGLSKLLLEHAFQFARRHWQVAGLKPYFIEITADMLKYLPFAEKAGMHFIGYTEGNLGRLRKDMDYISKNQDRVRKREILKEESVGIVDLQVGYATKLRELLDAGGPDLRTALRLMEFQGNRVTRKQYKLLHGLIRMPKPSYLRGLTPIADAFVQRRLGELKLSRLQFEPELSIHPIDASIHLRGISLSVNTRVRQTAKSRAIQEAFGIRPEHLSYPVIANLSVELPPKSVTLVVGPSGSGKTLLLSALTGKPRPSRGRNGSQIVADGEVSVPPNMRVGTIEPLSEDRPIIELFGGDDVKRAIYVLNMAGLSEANLYLRRFDELSAGQQYRAMIARMIDSGHNVWVADEFCSTLDPISALLVAHNLRKLSRKFGATLVVAAPHWEYFVGALDPDLVIYLMAGREHRLFSGSQFIRDVTSHDLCKREAPRA
jgi:ABC-type ATPase with predicted acetyltransferase domain